VSVYIVFRSIPTHPSLYNDRYYEVRQTTIPVSTMNAAPRPTTVRRILFYTKLLRQKETGKKNAM